MSEDAKAKRRAYQKEYRDKNKEKINKRQREWRANNKDKVKEYNTKYWEMIAQKQLILNTSN